MEGASERNKPQFFSKQNPRNDVEAATSRKQPPPEPSPEALHTPTTDETLKRPARSLPPAFDDSRNRRGPSTADSLADLVDLLSTARHDDSSGTQRNFDSGGNRSNTRSAIYSLTPNSNLDATPDDPIASDYSDDYSSSTTDSQICLKIHRRAGNRDQRRRKQLIKENEISDRNQQDDDNEETDTTRDIDEAEEIDLTCESENVLPDNAARTNAEMENTTNRGANLLNPSRVEALATRGDTEPTAAQRDILAQWGAGNYAVSTTNYATTNHSSVTNNESDAQKTTASSSRPSSTPSVDGSNLTAGRPSSIQFQRMPSEALKKISNTSELASLRPLLETQPDALHQIIIDASSSMLALKKSIFERETRYRKFGQPILVIDPATGIARTRTDGTPITTTFMPQSLRKMNNPAFATSDISEDHRVTTIKEATAELLQKYKTDMSDKMKELARLEVTIRKETLSVEFLKQYRYFADASIISRRASDDGLDDPERDRLFLRHEVVLNMLGKLEPDHLKELYLDSKEHAAGKYKEIFDDAQEQGPHWTQDIAALVDLLSTHLLQMLTIMSVNLFKKARDRATIRLRQSELLEFIANERNNAATDDLAEALDNSQAIQENTLNDVVSRKHLLNQSKAAKKLQKKSLGGDESQPPEPTDDGQSTSDSSKKRRGNPSSLKQPKQKKQKPGKGGAQPPSRPGETNNGVTELQDGPRQLHQKTTPTEKKKKKRKVRIQEDASIAKKSTTYKIPQTPTNNHSHQQNERTPGRGGRGRGGRGASQARGRGGRGRER